MAQVPFFNGKNVTLIFERDSKPVKFKAKSFSIKRNATLHADPVNGELRDRVGSTTNYFEGNIEAFMEDVEELKTLVQEVQQLDTFVQPVDKGAGFLVKPNNATRAAFQCIGISIDDWAWNTTGRAERSMMTIPFRAQDFIDTPTV